MSYELIDAGPEDFETAVRGFQAAGGLGLNVTVPHKEAAFAIADEVGPEAEAAGAVNTISFLRGRIRGDNTDGTGFDRDLRENLQIDPTGLRILILGAGGAARGILAPLITARPAELVLANRTLTRAAALKDALDSEGLITVRRFDQLGDQEPFDLVINATSAGLHGKTPPFPESVLGHATLCYDLAYSLKRTPFEQWAHSAGAGRVVQGWGMLVEQAAESFRIWRGEFPDTAPILKQMARWA
jgi:shikimate dehydrogenase